MTTACPHPHLNGYILGAIAEACRRLLDERLGPEVVLRLDEPGLRIYELMDMP